LWRRGNYKNYKFSSFSVVFNCGARTNTKAELLGARVTLTLLKLLDLHYLQVMGDSKVIIDWRDQKGMLQSINIEGWKRRIKDLIPTFNNIYFHHILKEANGEANHLSKQALSTAKRRITYFTWDGETAGLTRHVDIF